MGFASRIASVKQLLPQGGDPHMTERHPDCPTSEVRFPRATSPKLLHRRPWRRRGQTVTEYALILAYVGILTIQAMDALSFATRKEFISTNCSLIVGRMQGQSKDKQMAAVDAYLTDPANWQHADINKILTAILEIHVKMQSVIYGY